MLNFFAISGILIVITSAIMAVVMLVRTKSKLHLMWGIFSLLVMLWGIGVYNVGTSLDPSRSLFWWKIGYVGVIFIPILFTHFVHVFLGKRNYFFIGFLYALGLLYLSANIFTDFFIRDVHLVFNQFYYISPTSLYNSFLTLFALLIVYSHIILYRNYRKATNERRSQIEYFFLGSFIGFLGGGFSFLPVYSIDLYPYSNVAISLYPVVMGYAIFKYRLMNIKIITTQLFIVSLWVFTFVRTFIAPTGSQEQIFSGLLFVMTVIVGVLLVRSVMHEIEAREEIEHLALNLEQANERLKELDKLKSEFVSIASHQLRAPLTSIKGYASLILESSFGKITESVREAVQRIFDSSETMVSSVEDFLNVSRIEQGRMKYRFITSDAAEVTRSVIDMMKPIAKKKGLTLSYSDDKESSYPIKADIGKFTQVLTNLVDNAIKYTPHGTIGIQVTKNNQTRKVRIAIADTGIGMSDKTISQLFDKFTRADTAAEVNTGGTGLGLYVAAKIIKAHHGRIWAESEGAGKGSVFYVELNLSKT